MSEAKFLQRTAIVAGAGLGAIMLSLGASLGAPLTKDECARIVEERNKLSPTVTADMAKGPQWAKANLPSDRLAAVERYIVMEEQLAFRCGMARVKFDFPDDDPTVPAGPGSGRKADGKADGKVDGKGEVKKPAPRPPSARTAKARDDAVAPPATALPAPKAPPATPSKPKVATPATSPAPSTTVPSTTVPPATVAPPKPKPKPKPKPVEPKATDPS